MSSQAPGTHPHKGHLPQTTLLSLAPLTKVVSHVLVEETAFHDHFCQEVPPPNFNAYSLCPTP
jgi:hypothetical protein